MEQLKCVLHLSLPLQFQNLTITKHSPNSVNLIFTKSTIFATEIIRNHQAHVSQASHPTIINKQKTTTINQVSDF